MVGGALANLHRDLRKLPSRDLRTLEERSFTVLPTGGAGRGGAESPAGVGAWIIAYKAYGLVLSYYFYYPEPFLVLPFSPRRILHARLRPPLASLFPSLARFLSRAEERHASR